MGGGGEDVRCRGGEAQNNLMVSAYRDRAGRGGRSRGGRRQNKNLISSAAALLFPSLLPSQRRPSSSSYIVLVNEAVAAASQIIAYHPSCKQTSRRAAEGPHDSGSREYSVKATRLGNSGNFPELRDADWTTPTVTLTSLPYLGLCAVIEKAPRWDVVLPLSRSMASHPQGLHSIIIIIRNVRELACEGDHFSPERRLNGGTGVGPNVDPETYAFGFGRRFLCSAINHENAAGKPILRTQIFSAQLLTSKSSGEIDFLLSLDLGIRTPEAFKCCIVERTPSVSNSSRINCWPPRPIRFRGMYFRRAAWAQLFPVVTMNTS
ncbi:hypothetical protein B0H13DRAFT_2276279 [Mycena leptocephala]|nr:hypothetical protein B0H13DRAFT_2276279 [Mycena leptocephala]